MIAPISDRFDVFGRLDEREQSVLVAMREALERSVQPLLAEAWERGELPPEVAGTLVPLRLMDPPTLEGDDPSGLFEGYRTFELARIDASVATFYNGQSGLFRSTIARGGSPEQVRAWDPAIRSWELTGVFCLTEPDHGSDIARGISTRCRRDGAGWVVDGRKRWIGGADTADRLAVFAKDEDGGVRCLLVDRRAPGVTLRKIHGKTSLRIMQNFDIAFDAVRVEDEWRLGRIERFADVAECLGLTRSGVAWIAAGAAAGAYEAAVRYTAAREQFGRPIAGYQLVQQKLARMLANVTASLALVASLVDRAGAGAARDEDSSLAKFFTARALRETAALAREVCGGNGITLDHDVARFHADAEAIYSYEGTDDINALIVGRSITGIGAFTRPSVSR